MTSGGPRARVEDLTEAQRQVLRLFHTRSSAKEIGREIGITHWAVNERLRAARRVLGVSSSNEAARLLAEAEARSTYKRVVCDPELIAVAPEHVLFPISGDDRECPSPAHRTAAVREERAPYLVLNHPGLRLPLPRFRGERNDLTIRTRLIWIGGLALSIVIALAAIVSISSGAVHLAAQLFRGLP